MRINGQMLINICDTAIGIKLLCAPNIKATYYSSIDQIYSQEIKAVYINVLTYLRVLCIAFSQARPCPGATFDFHTAINILPCPCKNCGSIALSLCQFVGQYDTLENWIK